MMAPPFIVPAASSGLPSHEKQSATLGSVYFVDLKNRLNSYVLNDCNYLLEVCYDNCSS